MKTRWTFALLGLVVVAAPVAVLILTCPTTLSPYSQNASDDPYNSVVHEPLNKTRLSEWKNLAAQVHLAGPSTVCGWSEQLRAKVSNYGVPSPDDTEFRGLVTVTAFVTEKGQIWAGPKQDFYIETESGVIGGKLERWFLLWTESTIGRRSNERCDVGEVLNRLKDEVSGSTLHTFCYPSYEEFVKRSTDLDCLNGGALGIMTGAGTERVASLRVTGGTVRVDLQNVSGDKASAWIDIKSQKLLKVAEYPIKRPELKLWFEDDGLHVVVVKRGFPQEEDYWLCYSAIALIVTLLLTRWYRRHKRLREEHGSLL